MAAFGRGEFSEPKKKKRKNKDEIAIFEEKFDEMEIRIRDLIFQNNFVPRGVSKIDALKIFTKEIWLWTKEQ